MLQLTLPVNLVVGKLQAFAKNEPSSSAAERGSHRGKPQENKNPQVGKPGENENPQVGKAVGE